MTSDNPHATSAEPADESHKIPHGELKRFGIISHEQMIYEWNGYRYSHSADALAAAKRAPR
jgi:hypothetical protein